MTAARLNSLEDDDRNDTDPLELLLVFGKPVPVCFLLLEDAVALLAFRHSGAHRKAIVVLESLALSSIQGGTPGCRQEL
jgi:hypothetical protein